MTQRGLHRVGHGSRHGAVPACVLQGFGLTRQHLTLRPTAVAVRPVAVLWVQQVRGAGAHCLWGRRLGLLVPDGLVLPHQFVGFLAVATTATLALLVEGITTLVVKGLRLVVLLNGLAVEEFSLGLHALRRSVDLGRHPERLDLCKRSLRALFGTLGLGNIAFRALILSSAWQGGL